MADDANEDSWLYGTSNPDSTTNEEERGNENEEEVASKGDELQTAKAENEALAAIIQGDDVNSMLNKNEDRPGNYEESVEFDDPAHEMEEDEEATAAATVADTTEDTEKEGEEEKTGGESEAPGEDEEDDDDDDDSDDDINVVIGDIKAAPSTYNIKQRSNLLAGAGGQEKAKTGAQVGKFSIEEFEGVGTINGVAAHEFSIDSLEDKPWRKPGADITDYFNYGFNEETWRAYCERQKRFRVVESGVGLASLTQNLNPPPEKQGDGHLPPGQQAMIMHQGHMMGGPMGDHMPMPSSGLMPPPGGHLGPPPRFGIPRAPRPMPVLPGAKENAIQVMTAECREYSRPGQMPPNFGGPGAGDEPFFHEPEPFDYGYEPTQDSQWGNENPNWVPTGIKELTPGPNPVPPPQMSGPPNAIPNQMGVPPPQMVGPPPQLRHPHPGPLIGVMPPPNHAMGPPPMAMMMGPNGPPMRMPMGPPRMLGPNGSVPERVDEERERRRQEREWERERERARERERERPRRERSRSREKSRRRSKSRDKERERERERDRERDRERERDRSEKPEVEAERTDEERERRRRDRERDRERERSERDRDRSRRERSRSREKSRRRSKSREKERERSNKPTSASVSASSSTSRIEKKKSHRKEDEE